MSRLRCNKCRRAQSVCICHFFKKMANDTPIIILQHPSEAKKHYGTQVIVENCLPNVQCFIGEDFSQMKPLLRRLHEPSLQYYLVFPSSDAKNVSNMEVSIEQARLGLIFLDGTWRKAKKIWYQNPFLQTLPTIKLTPTTPSIYDIRKSRQPDTLSLLEAVAHSLAALGDKTTCDGLIDNFRQIIRFQKAQGLDRAVHHGREDGS